MILIAFGANLSSTLGSPQQTYHALPDWLAKQGIEVIQASSLYETAPVPASDQPNYMNAVLRVDTALTPEELLTALMKIEEALGRKRSVLNAARGIDLDLLAYNACVIDEGHLKLPHPRMHQRRFVLDPLLEIAPQWVHPVLNQSPEALLANLS